MSAYSTLYVSRSTVLAFIVSRLATASNTQLEDVADALLKDNLYRTYITSDGTDDETLERVAA